MSRRKIELDRGRLSSSSAYRERSEEDPSWYDRAADHLYARAWRPIADRVRNPTNGLRRILPLCALHEERYRKSTDAQLRENVAELKILLRRQGLSAEAVGQGLALMREVGVRTLEKRAYDVQMLGAFALLQGKLAEMATGEGKTLTASLAVGVAAMAGMPVHVVTVNDYLADRDAQTMSPIYHFLGLTVGVIVNAMTPDERRQAYRCDVTYCSNKELAFDYLKDKVTLNKSGGRVQMAFDSLHAPAGESTGLLLRGLHFAIVDEADSIFVDEAVTPLILSATIDGAQEAALYASAIEFARSLQSATDYTQHERERWIELTDAGKARLDIFSTGRSGVWTSRRARTELVGQALTALHLFQRDRHYVVAEGKVQIVDESTGRILPDRSWENGLHQMVEAKELCELSGRRVTLARITYQRLFRRYILLSGMTGTAKEVAHEIWSVYRLETVTIPLHKKSMRRCFPGHLYPDVDTKWQAVVDRTRELACGAGRAVLIGTRSVEASEQLSEALTGSGIAHTLLNAKQDKAEAEAIALAGRPFQVTVATNLAGRGTDIHLDSLVVVRGGLHVILTECHSSRRVDRQLIGRGARQGDPGSYELMVSIDDEVLRVYSSPFISFARRWVNTNSSSSSLLLPFLRFLAQFRAGRLESQTRRAMLHMDQRLDKTLAFSGIKE